MDPVNNVIEGIGDTVFTGPPGSGVGDLPVAVVVPLSDTEGHVRISRWRPDAHERKLIAEGGDIWLWVYGDGQPAVFLSGEAPVVANAKGLEGQVGLPNRRLATPDPRRDNPPEHPQFG